jgi:hypothetical protein
MELDEAAAAARSVGADGTVAQLAAALVTVNNAALLVTEPIEFETATVKEVPLLAAVVVGVV